MHHRTKLAHRSLDQVTRHVSQPRQRAKAHNVTAINTRTIHASMTSPAAPDTLWQPSACCSLLLCSLHPDLMHIHSYAQHAITSTQPGPSRPSQPPDYTRILFIPCTPCRSLLQHTCRMRACMHAAAARQLLPAQVAQQPPQHPSATALVVLQQLHRVPKHAATLGAGERLGSHASSSCPSSRRLLPAMLCLIV